MEKYFDLHGVPLLQNVCIASNYLEPNQFLWYKGLCSCKPLVTWSIFTEEMTTHYDDIKRNSFFSQLINLKQKGSMEENIEDFQKLKRRVNYIPDKQRIDVFIGTLKDNVQHEVRFWEPDSLEEAFKLERKIESEIMETRNPTTHDYNYGSVTSPSLPQPTWLTPQQLEEKREKGLCYNCDRKCTKGHKCAEKKLFYIEYEEEEEKDQETSKEEDICQEPTPEKEEMNPSISCKALARITTKTLKIEGHIKKKKVQEVKYHIKKEEINPTISCNALVGITTPQTINIEGHIQKKNPQEVKDHIKHQEMNLTISCKELEEITTPQTFKIGHIKEKNHIEHQQQVLQLLKDNATLVHNQMKQQVDQHHSEKSFDVGDWVFLWRHLKQAIYEKEMLAILHALKKW